MTDAALDALAARVPPRLIPVATSPTRPTRHRSRRRSRPAARTAIEVTFRTDAAPRALAALAGSGLVVGAGTIRTTTQVDEALAAGAQFVVSPALDPAVVERCLDAGVPVLPGDRDRDGAERRRSHSASGP